MHKVVVHAAGGHDKLKIEEHPTPEPWAGEVLVATQSIGVNFADLVVRMGLYESAKKYVGWPITPGFECAGRVLKVGAGVTDLVPGDEVIALVRFGAYATHVVAPREQVFRRPEKLDVLSAGAFFVVHLTAWYALAELCRLRPGRRVLVHSAAGGVGLALVRIAKILGAEVTGVVGAAHKVDTVRAAGADHVIDRSTEPLWKAAERMAPAGFHAVMDANGVETLRQSYAHLAPTGRLVVYGAHTMLKRGKDKPSYVKLAIDFVRTPWFHPLFLTNDNRGVLGFNLSYLFDEIAILHEALGALLPWIDDGRLPAPPVATFPLEKVVDAHAALESGSTVGKVVLVVS
jgi:NADPH:quinone reductase-like Zn-dependent oxidoreductase